MTETPSFETICSYNSDQLIDYCFNIVKCHQQFEKVTKLYPKSEKDSIQAIKFNKIVEGKSNVLVVVLTQYHLYGLFTEDPVPENCGGTVFEPNCAYIYEFFRDRKPLNPPTRYSLPTKKTYTFSTDISASLFIFSGALKIDKNQVQFFQRAKNLVDQNGNGGCFCGSTLQKEVLRSIANCQLE